MIARTRGAAGAGFRRGRPLFAALLALGMVLPAQAGLTLLKGEDVTARTRGEPVTAAFPLARFGDLGYDAIVQYQTQDGTAQAGLDYEAASGYLVIPAQASAASIPVQIAARGDVAADSTFQLAFRATGVGPQAIFSPALPLGAGPTPVSAAAVDLNGDGRLDLVSANLGNDSVSVLLNMTPPGALLPMFAPQQSFAVGAGPRSIAAVDVNGDGRPDLIVADGSANTVSVLVNTTPIGAPVAAFVVAQNYPVGNTPAALAVADLDGDGKPDIIVANQASGTVSVLLNTTPAGAVTSSFASQQSFAAGADPEALAVADLNGDGKADLVVADTAGRTLSVLLNATSPGAATPSFAAAQTIGVSNRVIAIAAADLNGDGRTDLVLASAQDNAVSALLSTTVAGASAASFADEQGLDSGTGPVSLAIVDLNGDGKPDLAVAYVGSDAIAVLRNQTVPGSGRVLFGLRQIIAATTPSALAAADLNGDGRPDLAAGNVTGGMFSVALSLGVSGPPVGFSSAASFPAGATPDSVSVADFNGDGLPDVASANLTSSAISVSLGTTSPGDEAATFAAQQAFATGSGPRASAVADFNGDGRPDLVTADENDNVVSVLLNTTAAGAGAAAFAPRQAFGVGAFPFAVASADLNGDGRPDIAVANAHDNTVSILLNTTSAGAATPSFAPQQVVATAGSPTSATLADVDGDGRPDLVVVSYSGSSVEVLLNTTPPGATTPSFAAGQAFATGRGPYWVEAGDVNGDGLPDLIVADGVDNTVSVLLNIGTRGASTLAFAERQAFAAGAKPSSISLADVDGDGRMDVVVANQNDNSVSVLLNTTPTGTGAASFAAQQTFATGATPIVAVARDVNGDGKPDLVVANLSDGNVSVLPNTQYLVRRDGNPATATIVHDFIFANGFD